MSLTVWDGDEGPRSEPPAWMLTGQMLLWNDGSPAHLQMEPFATVDGGWEAALQISRSVRDGTRWLPLTMRMTRDVRSNGSRSAPLPVRERCRSQLSTFDCVNGTKTISAYSS